LFTEQLEMRINIFKTDLNCTYPLQHTGEQRRYYFLYHI